MSNPWKIAVSILLQFCVEKCDSHSDVQVNVVKLDLLCCFPAFTGKSEPHVMSNGAGSILWSILSHYCCGTSGDTLSLNMQSLLCYLFSIHNSKAMPAWPFMWMQFGTVLQPEEAPSLRLRLQAVSRGFPALKLCASSPQ